MAEPGGPAYVALGDSISIDDYSGGPGRGGASLLFANRDEDFPEWRGRELSAVQPGMAFFLLAIDGATTRTLLQAQLPRLRALEVRPTLVTPDGRGKRPARRLWGHRRSPEGDRRRGDGRRHRAGRAHGCPCADGRHRGRDRLRPQRRNRRRRPARAPAMARRRGGHRRTERHSPCCRLAPRRRRRRDRGVLPRTRRARGGSRAAGSPTGGAGSVVLQSHRTERLGSRWRAVRLLGRGPRRRPVTGAGGGGPRSVRTRRAFLLIGGRLAAGVVLAGCAASGWGIRLPADGDGVAELTARPRTARPDASAESLAPCDRSL